jgi:PAS domain S-box-containing protein
MKKEPAPFRFGHSQRDLVRPSGGAEEALRGREALLGSIVNSIAAPVTLCTPAGEIEAVNQFGLDFHGKTLEEIKSWAASDLIHSADLSGATAAWKRSIESGKPYNIEVRLRRGDGVYRWTHSHGFPVKDADGRIVRWCILHTDIHDRVQAQEALAASEYNLNRIINAIPVLVWSARVDGSIDFVNEHYLDYVGLSLDQVREWGWTATVHPDDLQGLIADWHTIIASGRQGEMQARLRRFDGQYRWFLHRVNPLHDDAGNVIWYGVNTDIEEQKRVEEALRASEWNLRRMTETIPQMLWSATAVGAIDYCNARLLDYTGLTAEGVMGNGWPKLLHPDDVEQAVRTWQACITTGEPYQVEIRIIHAADRTYRWCLTTALPLRDEQGRIIKWHGACVDMHDWKQAQDELRGTQAELAHMSRVMTMGQLTASIAHELNQPLAGIITNASTCLRMLGANPPNVAGALETARRTIRDGNRASEVITRLRALFSKRSKVVEDIDLNAASQEVVALTSTELQRNSVSLRAQFSDDLPLVRGDRIQLQQVILNLIMNAVEAMSGVSDRPRELLITTECDGSGSGVVRLAVRDTGAGVDPLTVEKLFSPFYTTKSNGMGIGLSVCRSIVENHQGRLGVAANDGPGATFFFSVPCRPERQTDNNGVARAEALPAARKMDNP